MASIRGQGRLPAARRVAKPTDGTESAARKLQHYFEYRNVDGSQVRGSARRRSWAA
jgi:hypothetical protein